MLKNEGFTNSVKPFDKTRKSYCNVVILIISSTGDNKMITSSNMTHSYYDRDIYII